MNQNELKELHEQRSAKAKELVTLLDTKELTAEQRSKLTALRSEVSNMDDQLSRAVEAIKLASGRAPDLSKQERSDISKFDFGVLLRGMAATLDGKPNTLSGIEAEMIQEGEKEAKEAQVSARGIVLPRALVRQQDRRAIREGRSMTATGTTSTTGDQGGMTVATIPQGLLDDFYNALVMERAGITVLEGLRGNLNLPRYKKPTNPGHKSENASGDALSPTTAMLSLSPKRISCYIDMSEQLMMQASLAIETIVRGNLSTQLPALIQDSWINGTGANGQPSGILSSAYTLSTVYAGGATAAGTNANGSAQAYSDWTRLRTAVAKQNALIGRPGFLTNSQVVGQAFETKRGKANPSDSTTTDSRMIIDDAETMRVAGFPVFETNSVPASLSKGASSGILSANIFGNWQDFVGAFWSGINLELLRDATIGVQGLYRLAASVYYDGGILRTESFAKCIDINAP